MRVLLFVLLLLNFVYGDKIVTIASYNVDNLFDLEESGYEYDEYTPNSFSEWNQKNYKIKLQNIAKVIKDINADIIALEEVESLQALKDLRFTLQREGLYYQYYAIADKKNTTVTVAFLSKLPFVYAKEVSVTASLKHRNILEAKFSINNKDLYLFINHWKAKTGPESERIVSAKALINRVEALGYDKNIVLVGDFNSDYEEYIKFERKRKLNDTNGKTGINHILGSLHQKEKASNTKYEKESFYNLWYDVKEEERYSYIYKKEKETLDNILISQSLLHKKEIFYKNQSMHSFKAPYLFKGKKINEWKTSRQKPIKHEGEGYSDHLPVIAEFIIN